MEEQEGCLVWREVWAGATCQAKDETPGKKVFRRLGNSTGRRESGRRWCPGAQGESILTSDSRTRGVRGHVHKNQDVVSGFAPWRRGWEQCLKSGVVGKSQTD